VPDAAGEVAFEAANRVAVGLAFGAFAVACFRLGFASDTANRRARFRDESPSHPAQRRLDAADADSAVVNAVAGTALPGRGKRRAKGIDAAGHRHKLRMRSPLAMVVASGHIGGVVLGGLRRRRIPPPEFLMLHSGETRLTLEGSKSLYVIKPERWGRHRRPQVAIAGGFAPSGRGARWARMVAGLVALAPIRFHRARVPKLW
jgi:hypothetical protein